MDIFDHASALEAKQTEMAINHHLGTQLKTSSQKSAKECQECGTPIPAARQEYILGCQYCTGCQELVEQGKL